MLSYLLRIGNLRLIESSRKMCSVSLAARNRIIWIDLEVNRLIEQLKDNLKIFAFFVLQMTGLDDTKDHIIEAACLVTEGDLKMVAEGPNIIVHQPEHILNSMNDWCKKHHGEVR